MSVDGTARGLGAAGLKKANSVTAAAIAATLAATVVTEKVDLLDKDFYDTETIGANGTLVAGIATADNVYMSSEPFEMDGEIFEAGWRGIGSGGVGVVHLKIASVAGGNYTQKTDNAFDSTTGVNNVKNLVNGGLTQHIKFNKGDTHGWYMWNAAASSGQRAQIGTDNTSGMGAPAMPCYLTAGNQTGTWAKGTWTNVCLQAYIKVRYANGEIKTIMQALKQQLGRQIVYGKNSSETINTGSVNVTTGNTTIEFEPRPFKWTGRLKSWELNAVTPSGTPAPLWAFLIEIDENGVAVDVYSAVRFLCSDGVNTFTRAAGTLPELYVRKDRRVVPGYLTQTSGAKIVSTTGGNSLPSTGYMGNISLTGVDVLGPNTMTLSTANRRYDHRIVVESVKPRTPNSKIVETRFPVASRPWFVRATTANLNYGAGYLQIAVAGLANGARGIVEEALDKMRVIGEIELGSDVPCFGKAQTFGNYGSYVEIDVAANTIYWKPRNGFSSTGGAVAAMKVAPFSTPLAAGQTIRIEMAKDTRVFHWLITRNGEEMAPMVAADIVNNPAAGAKTQAAIVADTAAEGSSLTFDLSAWTDETDLGRFGMQHGTWFFSTSSGTGSKLTYLVHDGQSLKAHVKSVGDSMIDSRQSVVAGAGGLLRAKFAEDGRVFTLNNVHGTDMIAHRLNGLRLMDYMDNLEGLFWNAGMNDHTGSQPLVDVTTAASFLAYAAKDQGCWNVICDVDLTWDIAGSPSQNDRNKLVTTGLRALVTALGPDNAASVKIQDYFSIDALGVSRYEPYYFGLTDPHRSPTGHIGLAKAACHAGGVLMGLTPMGLPAKIVPDPL